MQQLSSLHQVDINIIHKTIKFYYCQLIATLHVADNTW